MKYTFVGDIHGKVDQVKRALDMDGQIIFVGDFMDSFDRNLEDHEECLKLVIGAIKVKKARAIYGNHELSYIFPHHECSGWNLHRKMLMQRYCTEIRTLFEPYILLEPRVLISHAGLTDQIWKGEKLSVKKLDIKLSQWWPDLGSPMHWIGLYRGGLDKVGGMFWCDWNAEFQPVKGLTQIFGHTVGAKIRQIEQSFCIDCLDHEHKFLHMEFE